MKQQNDPKAWDELIACARRSVPNAEMVAAVVLGEIRTSNDEDALEWLMLAMLAARADAVEGMRDFLKARKEAVEHPPLKVALGAVADVVGARFESQAGVTTERVHNLLRRLAGHELPS